MSTRSNLQKIEHALVVCGKMQDMHAVDLDFANLPSNFDTGLSSFLDAMNASSLSVHDKDYFPALKNSIRFWTSQPYYMDPSDEPSVAVNRSKSTFAQEALFLSSICCALRNAGSIFIDSSKRDAYYATINIEKWLDLAVKDSRYWTMVWESVLPTEEMNHFVSSRAYLNFEQYFSRTASHMIRELSDTLDLSMHDVISHLSKKATVEFLEIDGNLTL